MMRRRVNAQPFTRAGTPSRNHLIWGRAPLPQIFENHARSVATKTH